MIKEFLQDIGIIRDKNVAPGNLLANSFLYRVDDTVDNVARGNILGIARFVDKRIQEEQRKIVESNK